MGSRRLPEDDALTCRVCTNVLCDPVTLHPCGHSFCAHCVDARLDAGHADCALCQHGIEGTLLDFSLKAAVEERHAATLASRRASLQLRERTIFSRMPRAHTIGFLHLVTNVWPWMRERTMECCSIAARLYRVIRPANDAAAQRACLGGWENLSALILTYTWQVSVRVRLRIRRCEARRLAAGEEPSGRCMRYES